jgi:hypothetical protein
MRNVTVLFSYHIEIGNCNSIELYKIICSINPEIIFEELDIDGFNDHYGLNGAYSTETKAIYQFIQNKNIKHIPVDTYDMGYFTKDENKYMNDIVCRNSGEYRKSISELLELVNMNGYEFLNSDECGTLLSEVQNIENEIQKQLNDKKLKEIYKNWIEINNERENEIIKNIYDYCKNNVFNKGLLITGAEHREALINKIRNNENKDMNINWDYWK